MIGYVMIAAAVAIVAIDFQLQRQCRRCGGVGMIRHRTWHGRYEPCPDCQREDAL
jgi:hypothetical protein